MTVAKASVGGRGGVGLGNVIASESLKLRSVRSTYVLFGTLALLVLGCAAVGLMMTLDWDSAPAEIQSSYSSADIATLVMSFAPFLLGTLGALVVTSEYATGMIRNSLIAAPRRGVVLTAKAAVVGIGTLVAGQLVSFACWLATVLIVGDRPAPINPWVSPEDGLPITIARGVLVAVVGLVGLGFGMLIRATAGALSALAGLLFVLPVIALMLPASIGKKLYAVLPPNLPDQLVGSPESLLSPVGAGLVMAAYAAAALLAGGIAFHRRDA